VPEFRYDQFCPLARAAEVVGERWTLLVIRELLLGPKRFSDLRRALGGVSPSVLTERLTRLEARGVIARSEVQPPTPATLYTLTPVGERLRPTLLELTRWGAGLLTEFQEGDHMEPDWLRLGVAAFARRTASPARSFEIHLDGAAVFQVAGGPHGTEVRSDLEPTDVVLRVSTPFTLLALVSGGLDPDAALRAGEIEAEGDLAALPEFPELFDVAPDRSEPHHPQGA
jgi:DNA-binding HxlR family transcriptional regulator